MVVHYSEVIRRCAINNHLLILKCVQVFSIITMTTACFFRYTCVRVLIQVLMVLIQARIGVCVRSVVFHDECFFFVNVDFGYCSRI
jgi:hypothetical protein